MLNTMKKLLGIVVLGLLVFSNVNAEERESELNNLFKQLKNSETTKAIEIENKIWKIWLIHPSNDRRGYRLTELLAQGSFLMTEQKLNRAYDFEIHIISSEPYCMSVFKSKRLNIFSKQKVLFLLKSLIFH